MYEDTIVSFSHPERVSIEDPLTQVLRSCARRLLAEDGQRAVWIFVYPNRDLGVVGPVRPGRNLQNPFAVAHGVVVCGGTPPISPRVHM